MRENLLWQIKSESLRWNEDRFVPNFIWGQFWTQMSFKCLCGVYEFMSGNSTSINKCTQSLIWIYFPSGQKNWWGSIFHVKRSSVLKWSLDLAARFVRTCQGVSNEHSTTQLQPIKNVSSSTTEKHLQIQKVIYCISSFFCSAPWFFHLSSFYRFAAKYSFQQILKQHRVEISVCYESTPLLTARGTREHTVRAAWVDDFSVLKNKNWI